MKSLPSVSVAIPCHNYGQFLAEAYESVRAQTLPPRDIVIVDDGSTDDSLARAQEIGNGDPRVRIIHNAAPVGAPRCFNMSVGATGGELVVILSADDRLPPDYLHVLVTAILDHGWDFAYPKVVMFGAEDGELPAHAFSRERLLFNNFITGSTMFRRAAYDAVDGFDSALGSMGHEDWDFWLRVVRAGFVGGPVPEVHLEWRRHASGSRNTSSTRRYRLVRLRMWQRHWRIAPMRSLVAYGARATRDRLAGRLTTRRRAQ